MWKTLHLLNWTWVPPRIYFTTFPLSYLSPACGCFVNNNILWDANPVRRLCTNEARLRSRSRWWTVRRCEVWSSSDRRPTRCSCRSHRWRTTQSREEGQWLVEHLQTKENDWKISIKKEGEVFWHDRLKKTDKVPCKMTDQTLLRWPTSKGGYT